MIIGQYPCCEGDLTIEVPERTPAYREEACPHCGAKVWHKLSRLDPQSWTEADFLAEYVVDEETMTIRPIKEPVPIPAVLQGLIDFQASKLADAWSPHSCAEHPLPLCNRTGRLRWSTRISLEMSPNDHVHDPISKRH